MQEHIPPFQQHITTTCWMCSRHDGTVTLAAQVLECILDNVSGSRLSSLSLHKGSPGNRESNLGQVCQVYKVASGMPSTSSPTRWICLFHPFDTLPHWDSLALDTANSPTMSQSLVSNLTHSVSFSNEPLNLFFLSRSNFPLLRTDTSVSSWTIQIPSNRIWHWDVCTATTWCASSCSFPSPQGCHRFSLACMGWLK